MKHLLYFLAFITFPSFILAQSYQIKNFEMLKESLERKEVRAVIKYAKCKLIVDV